MATSGAMLGAAGFLFSACSLLIGSETAPLRCSQEGQLGPPACDAGFVCKEGVCQLAPPPTDADGGEGGGDGYSGSPGGPSGVGVAGAGAAAR
jgi:hypothetical protein